MADYSGRYTILGDNGKRLKATHIDGHSCMVFSGDDRDEREVVFVLKKISGDSYAIKSEFFNKYWKAAPGDFPLIADLPKKPKEDRTGALFTVEPIHGHYVALRNVGTNKYCRRHKPKVEDLPKAVDQCKAEDQTIAKDPHVDCISAEANNTQSGGVKLILEVLPDEEE